MNSTGIFSLIRRPGRRFICALGPRASARSVHSCSFRLLPASGKLGSKAVSTAFRSGLDRDAGLRRRAGRSAFSRQARVSRTRHALFPSVRCGHRSDSKSFGTIGDASARTGESLRSAKRRCEQVNPIPSSARRMAATTKARSASNAGSLSE